MSRNTLTDKERIFALAVADGKSQYDAYCLAYDTKTTNRATIDTNAYKIAAKPAVKEYIATLRKQREEKTIYSDINDKNKRIALIWERIEVCKAKGDDASIARYTEQLAKLNGDYVNINKNIDTSKDILKDISTEDLKSLLNDVD